MISGCDNGKEVVDEVTGNRAVKQYHKSIKDTEKIADQQAERIEVSRMKIRKIMKNNECSN